MNQINEQVQKTRKSQSKKGRTLLENKGNILSAKAPWPKSGPRIGRGGRIICQAIRIVNTPGSDELFFPVKVEQGKVEAPTYPCEDLITNQLNAPHEAGEATKTT